MDGLDQKTAKASWSPGTMYCVDGGGGWFYYGQVSATKGVIGFLHYRTATPASCEDVDFAAPIMCRVSVALPSVGRALRSSSWRLLGMKPLHPDLRKPYGLVICSVGTNVVQASLHVDLPNDAGSLIKAWQTRTDDPEIQDFEVIAAWDAEHHIPGRLKADFGDEDAAWHISGPLWRHLRVKQEYAKRFPDHPGSRIPKD